MTPEELAQYIDHTLLKPDALPQDLDALCHDAATYRFKAVCVNSAWVARVTQNLEDTDVVVCSVIGFPLGAVFSGSKAFEAARAVEHGARELDMVLNVGALKAGDRQFVEEDIRAVRSATPAPIILKVIIETCLLTDTQKTEACRIAQHSGADYVKTSTGFAGGGATPEDIALMRAAVDPSVGVKASGGIKDAEATLGMIAAGANRIGTSSGVAIISSI